MCEPTTIMAVASLVVGAGMAVYQGRQQSKAIEEQMRLQQEQTNEAASSATNERIAEARRMRATARASAAESAVSGNSLFAVESDVEAQLGRDTTMIERNRQRGNEAAIKDAQARSRGARAEAIAGVASSAMNSGDIMYQNYQIKKYGGGPDGS